MLVALTGGLIWFGAVLLTGPNPAVAQTNYFFTNATTTAQSWSFSIWSNTLNNSTVAPGSGGSSNFSITFNGNATFDATNDLGTAANGGFQLNQLIFNAGTPTLYGSNLVFMTSSTGVGPQLLQNTGNNLIINNGLVFSNNTIFGGSGGGSLTFNGALGGNGGLIKTTTGTLTLNSASTYSGGTVVNAGILQAAADYALGSGPIAVNANTLLQLDTGRSAISGADSNTPLAITLAPGSTLKLASATSTNYGNNIATAPGAGTIYIYSGNQGATNILGNLTINGAQTLSASGNNYNGYMPLTFGTVSMLGNAVFDLPNTSGAQVQFWKLGAVGEIGGNWTLTKNSAGTLTFTTVNTYSGGTVINGGVVEAAADYSMGRGPITVNSTLQLDTTRGAISSIDNVTPLPITMVPGSWLTLSPTIGAIYGNNLSITGGTGTVTIHTGNSGANNTLGNVSIGYSGGTQTL